MINDGKLKYMISLLSTEQQWMMKDLCSAVVESSVLSAAAQSSSSTCPQCRATLDLQLSYAKRLVSWAYLQEAVNPTSILAFLVL